MREFIYSVNSVWIAGVLFASMLVAIEAGYRIGLRNSSSANESSRTHINTIQASLLGILALLLGFTFSLALQRFDSRSEAVVGEANAIGTAYLRADLLPAAFRLEVKALLRDYVDARVQAGSIALAEEAGRAPLLVRAGRIQNALWAAVVQAAEDDPSPVRSGLFIQSLNDLIDAFGRRDAALTRHVPEVVLLLLYGTFVMAGGILGYASGVCGHRPSLVSYILVALIVLLVFIIIDLDRPRRGLIEVSQQSLVALQAAIAEVDAQGRNAAPEDARPSPAR